MRLLIVAPMTGLPRFNVDAIDEAAARLRASGHLVVSPADLDRAAGLDLDGPPPSVEWIQEARRRCLAVLVAGEPMKIGAVVALTGWWRGFGRREVEIARGIGIPVLGEDMQPIDEIEM